MQWPLHEFLEPLGITQYRLAKANGVSQRRIGEIVSGDHTVTADTGLRLSRYFGVSDKFWIGLQADFDAAMTKEKLADQSWPGGGALSLRKGTRARAGSATPGNR
jgi:antitoxin HigA-1